MLCRRGKPTDQQPQTGAIPGHRRGGDGHSIAAFFVVPRLHPQPPKSTKKNCGIGKKVWSDAASTGEMSGTDTGKNVSGNRSGNWTQKMGNP